MKRAKLLPASPLFALVFSLAGCDSVSPVSTTSKAVSAAASSTPGNASSQIWPAGNECQITHFVASSVTYIFKIYCVLQPEAGHWLITRGCLPMPGKRTISMAPPPLTELREKQRIRKVRKYPRRET